MCDIISSALRIITFSIVFCTISDIWITTQSQGWLLCDDQDQDQWSTITQITVHKRNWWIRNKSGIISSFDVPWSEWSWITDPDPDRPKGTHTKVKASNLENLSENESLIFLSHSKKFTRWIEEQIFSGTRWEKSPQEERISYAT